MEETIEGYVDHIIFRNQDNGYTVMVVVTEDEELTCVGSFQYMNEGETIKAFGHYTEHPSYGRQFVMSSYEVIVPQDSQAMERYLASGAVKGIGAALAARIVRRFKEDTLRIMEEEPERLAEVKGISLRKAQEISDQIVEKSDMRKAMMFLQQYGISLALGGKIYKQYGPQMYHVLKENPYQMAEDVEGIGFKIADEIAGRIGILPDSDYRIRSGLLYILTQASAEGHVYLPKKLLLRRASALLCVEESYMEKHIMDLAIERKVVIKEIMPGEEEQEQIVYASQFYQVELHVAQMLKELDLKEEINQDKLKLQLDELESAEEITLDEKQRQAVMQAASNGLLVVTGGPGTGKTTTINAIIRYFEQQNEEILLAAPTGRAAKRMAETTGYEAKTIHRLLELSGMPENQTKKGIHFERNAQNPLEADVIIIDEMSMVDIFLFHNLLKAIAVGTRLILVGDVNQLPSVGPGNVLRDVINSHCFNVVRLSHIFRQAAESDIIVNAHRIHRGEEIALDNQSKDFFCLKRDDSHGVLEVMLWLVRDRMPKYTHCTPFDVQVLTPMKKGELGVHRCNEVLQRYLNPEAPGKNQMELHGVLFREGDKVMQMKNNYQIKWEIRGYNHMMIEEGSGVFNGDCGIITEIDTFNKEVTVRFDDEKYVTYPQGNLDELELAYAITIHKSQGSEYPAVVLPILSGPRPLMNRNILYTAVTRGKKCVTIVGNKDTVREMIQNKSEQMRYSSLCRRLQELEQESLEK